MGAERAGPEADRVLVVACGNPLRGDDGVGPAVAELIAAELEASGARALISDQLLPELAEDVSQARWVVFIDAAADRPAGSVTLEPVAARAAPPAGSPGRGLDPFSHGMAPADLLSLARDLYSATPDAVVVSVGAASFAAGEGLSPVVRTALLGAARVALDAVRAGYPEPGGA
ncbi:MAG: hydrogenase maturation protease [Candidatus Dormibacteria bacterium]